MSQKSSVGEMGMVSNLRVGETGVGEMGVGKTGVGEMGIGEMEIHLKLKAIAMSVLLCKLRSFNNS